MNIKLILLIIFILLFKVIYNLYYYLLANLYYKKYIEYVKNQKSWFIEEHKQKIIKLFVKAGIEDSEQPHTELAGFGMVRSSNFSIFKNLTVLRQDIVELINGDFHEAIGVYKQRIFETFNPFYWIEQVIFLPKTIFSYIGIPAESIFIKIILLLYWLISFASTIIGIFFNKEFINWFYKL